MRRWQLDGRTGTHTAAPFDPVTDVSGVYTYAITGQAPCPSDSRATVTVLVEALPDAGVDALVDVCGRPFLRPVPGTWWHAGCRW